MTPFGTDTGDSWNPFDMTTPTPVSAGDTPSPGSSGSREGRRLAATAAAVFSVIAVGVAATVVFGRWTSPSVFRDGDADTLAVRAQPLTAFPLYVGFGNVDTGVRETLTVNSADIHFAQDSANFIARVLVCTQRPVEEGTLRLGTSLAQEGSLSQYCTAVRPLKAGTRVRLEGSSGEYLVTALTPSRAGSAHIDSININYSRDAHHLFQRGTQVVKQDITIAAE